MNLCTEDGIAEKLFIFKINFAVIFSLLITVDIILKVNLLKRFKDSFQLFVFQRLTLIIITIFTINLKKSSKLFAWKNYGA